MSSRRVVRRAAVAASALGAALFLALPGSASAVTVGETFVPEEDCGPGECTALQTASPGAQYIVPFPGLVTSWSFRAGATPPDVKLKVGRSAGGNDYTIVGTSGLESPTPSSLNTFPAPANFRVEAGDIVGLYNATVEDTGRLIGGYNVVYFNDDVLPGATETFVPEAGVQLDVSAEVKPFRCGGKNATIAGTEGRDRPLEGTGGPDVIAALGGKDRVKALGGKDVVCGAKGKDKLKGAKGKDKLKGAKGRDVLNGGKGKDKLKGAKGRDVLVGGKGKDKLAGGKGKDKLKARDGKKDRVNCGPGNDTAKVDAKDKVRKCETVKVG
jgi:Ca2+-binding RTX toxin-like protein